MFDADIAAPETARKPEIKEALKRRFVMWLGRFTRHSFSSIIAKYSLVGDPPVFASTAFPWARSLEENWEVIRAEADTIIRRKNEIPSVIDISPDHKGIADEKWKSFFLWGYGYRID